ncbi:MAG: putative amino acid dehydrogenase [Kiritimatiellia bacterium]|jgi:predicted amino acid dehydrogenase
MSAPRVAFLVHPLMPWQRRVLGVRHMRPELWRPGAAAGEMVSARIRCDTSQGPAEAIIISVPALPAQLLRDQPAALELQVEAANRAAELGCQMIGLGSALAVVAGRGQALAERCAMPVTTGNASTAWAAAAITLEVCGDEPVGVLGFKGTVGDAVAGALAEHRTVYVVATGRAARRAAQLGCRVVDLDELLAKCRVIVGASTTGPQLQPGRLQPGTVLVDLALPATLAKGERPAGVVELAGETLRWPGRVRGGAWGKLWLAFAGYGRGCVYACLAEPIAAARTDQVPWSQGRRLEVSAVKQAGRTLRDLGFEPVLIARRGP